MNFFLLLVMAACLSAKGYSQEERGKLIFAEVYFGSGFGADSVADSVELRIDNVIVYENEKLFSIESYGKANGELTIFRVKKNVFTYNFYNESAVFIGKARKNEITIDIVFRGENRRFKVNLNEGKYLVFSVTKSSLEMIQTETRPNFS